jgi:hypothetical protein
MGKASLSKGFRDLLRRFPKAYHLLRRIHSILVRIITETSRLHEGFYSSLSTCGNGLPRRSVRRNEVEGTICAEGSADLEAGPGSVTTKVGWDIKS